MRRKMVFTILPKFPKLPVGKVSFQKFHQKIFGLVSEEFLLPVGTNRSRITLPFDHFSRFKSSAEGKWPKIRHAGSGNDIG